MKGWRPALRLAWRDAVRARGRSILVLVMIALPVLAVTAAAGCGLEVVRALLALAQGVPVDAAPSLARVLATATVALVVVPVISAVERRAEQRRFA